MTVKELIELLKKENPKAQALLFFTRYTKHRHISQATRPVSYPIEKLHSHDWESKVWLMAEQKGDYG